MLAFLFSWNLSALWSNPLMLIFWLFALWMLVDAFRQEQWMWVLFIIIFPLINAPLYYFLVYRQHGGGISFSIPGSADRKRIKELEQQIHHLDKAHHYFELADILYRQGDYAEAEKNYVASLERESDDIDARAHLGHCLMAQKRYGEAKDRFEDVCMEDPKHEYGRSLIALGECMTELGELDSAIDIWEQAITQNSYAQPRIRLAEALLRDGAEEKKIRARQLVEDVLREETLTPEFQRKQEAEWVNRARKLSKMLK